MGCPCHQHLERAVGLSLCMGPQPCRQDAGQGTLQHELWSLPGPAPALLLCITTLQVRL